MVSGKSQKETARHTSTLPYKEEEIFGEFHTSFAFLFHSFHFKWQATLVVLCHVRLQHQFDSYFVSFLCVYICILWGPLRISSWACWLYSPSTVTGTQYLGCRVDYSLAPPSSTISPVMNRGDYQLLPLLLPPSNINIVLSSPSLSSIINYPAWERRLSFLRWFLHYLRLAPSSIILFFSSPDYLCFAATCKTQASPHCYYRMKRQKT